MQRKILCLDFGLHLSFSFSYGLAVFNRFIFTVYNHIVVIALLSNLNKPQLTIHATKQLQSCLVQWELRYQGT